MSGETYRGGNDITKVDSPNETASSRVVYDQIVLGAGTSGLTYLYYAALRSDGRSQHTRGEKQNAGDQRAGPLAEFQRRRARDAGQAVNRTTLGQPKSLLGRRTSRCRRTHQLSS